MHPNKLDWTSHTAHTVQTCVISMSLSTHSVVLRNEYVIVNAQCMKTCIKRQHTQCRVALKSERSWKCSLQNLKHVAAPSHGSHQRKQLVNSPIIIFMEEQRSKLSFSWNSEDQNYHFHGTAKIKIIIFMEQRDQIPTCHLTTPL